MILAAALAAQSLAVSVEPFPGLDQPRRSGCLVLRQGLTLSGGDGFGGYSAMELAETGDGRADILLVSDTGHLLSLTGTLDEKGDLVAVSGAERSVLVGRDGAPLGKRTGDSEGLARLDGRLVVSFEGRDRLSVIEEGRETESVEAPAADQALLGKNSGYEALAALPGGRLLVISEGKDEDGLSRLRTGPLGMPLAAWAEARYRAAEDFNPTGADLDEATGDLFVLERAFSRLKGPRARIVRVPQAALGDAVVEGRSLGTLGFLEGVDNMEGIEVKRSAAGDLLIALVSDDNFSDAQRTVLMSLGLAPGCDDRQAPEPALRRDPPPELPVDPEENH